MENKEYRKTIIDMYRDLVNNVIFDISDTEKIIVEQPDMGTVRDGGKAIDANECRQLVSLLLTEYYSTKNLDKWNEYKNLLQSRIENELNCEKNGVTTEKVSKKWATSAFLKYMRCTENKFHISADNSHQFSLPQ